MRPIIDADILLYEIGFGSETGWQKGEEIPPFDYVLEMLLQRIATICYGCNGTENPTLFLTGGRSFRYDIAKRKLYKGTRVHKKPWHFDNLKAYMIHNLNSKVSNNMEADDELAIEHTNSKDDTVLCSRDKDLRTVPGNFYSWELGLQPSYGPLVISKKGSIVLSDNRKRIIGNGLSFFYAQLLWGDISDNIPGLPGCGPIKTYNELMEDTGDMLGIVVDLYENYYGADWEEELLEQGRLCWMTRRLHKDGSPVLWEIGMEE